MRDLKSHPPKKTGRRATPGLVTIPLLEEELSLSKRRIVTGKTRVSTVTDVTEAVASRVLQTEDVVITRVAINKIIDKPPEVRKVGNVTIVPILEEIMIVEKKLVLLEEIHIAISQSSSTVQQPVKLRKQRAIIEQLDGDTLSSKKSDSDPSKGL